MHFQYILFDLDNTLYPPEAGVMKVISERILCFMIHKMGIAADDATAKRHLYFQKYGTVLQGLMKEERVDPDEYLDYVHNFDPGLYLGASPPLDHMLKQIPLTKVIYTNADVNHSERVLSTLKVRPHFEQIIDIKAMNFENKPSPKAYQHVLEILNVPGDCCIMVDDMPRNLIPAKDLGMTTILVNEGHQSLAVDFAVPTIFHVENILKSILPMEKF